MVAPIVAAGARLAGQGTRAGTAANLNRGISNVSIHQASVSKSIIKTKLRKKILKKLRKEVLDDLFENDQSLLDQIIEGAFSGLDIDALGEEIALQMLEEQVNQTIDDTLRNQNNSAARRRFAEPDFIDEAYESKVRGYSSVGNTRRLREQRERDEQLEDSAAYIASRQRTRRRNLQRHRKQIAKGRKMASAIGAQFGDAATAVQRVKLLRSLYIVGYVSSLIFLVQFVGWLISLVGLAAEIIGETFSLTALAGLFGTTVQQGVQIAADNFQSLTGIRLSLAQLIPGISLVYVGWAIAAIAGLVNLLFCTVVFILNGVRCFDTGSKIGWFTFALIGYMAPLVNFFPYGIIWLLVLFKDKKASQTSDVTWYSNSTYEEPQPAANTNRAPIAGRRRRAA